MITTGALFSIRTQAAPLHTEATQILADAKARVAQLILGGDA